MRDATFCGLNNWNKYLFEKLGWMLLAKQDGHKMIIDTYKYNINELISHLINKKKSTIDKDRKKDLDIILSNVKILKTFVDKNL